ncbi:MAG: thiosulfate oxidation carrier protein SoxY [Pseudomonadota bacterium]|nr:thiosulfate oxidation carrier protein SoxY [Pseudomonadota bacterium]
MNTAPAFSPLRRRQLVSGAGALALGAALPPAAAQSSAVEDNPLLAPNPAEFKRLLNAFTGGKTPASSGLKLEVSALADNPSAVPVRVAVTQPITAQNWCEEIIVLAELNPLPLACTLKFTALTGSAEAAVRVRLSQSQTIHALARMKDGSLLAASQAVTVAAGGCGM